MSRALEGWVWWAAGFLCGAGAGMFFVLAFVE